MNWKCVMPDCQAVMEDADTLIMRFPARSYKKGEFGAKEDVTFPAREVKKCQWCRGNLVETEETPREPL